MSEPASPTPWSLTDSFWFWLMLFSAVGLLAMLVIAPKYTLRQRRLEMQFRAFDEADRRRAAGEERAKAEGQEGSAAPPGIGELLIPLWPVALVLLTVNAFAASRLWRERARHRGWFHSSDSGGST